MKFFLLIATFFFSTFLYGQDFNSAINGLSQNLKPVTTKSSKIEQSISVQSPGVVEYSMTETDINNGKSETQSFVFNLADIDINTVRATTDNDVIAVQLLVDNEQKLIKKTEGQTDISYTDAVYFRGSDINNGRALADLVKAAIPMAVEITEKRLSLSSYEDHLNWLVSEIGEVTLPEKQFLQSMAANPKYPGSLVFSVVESDSKNSEKRVFAFNAMNINPNAILFKVSGDVFSLEIGTKRKLDVIKPKVDGEQGNYTEGFEIICESVEQARDLQKVLKEFTALSQVEFEKALPDFTSLNQAISTVNALIGEVVVNEITFAQSLEENCVTTFSKNEVSSSKQTSQEFSFNFADLNKNTVSYNTQGEFLFVEMEILDNADYIKLIEDNEQGNYTSSFEIACSEIEDAIILETAFQYIIDQCNNKILTYEGKDKTELLAMLYDEIKTVTIDGETQKQSLAKGTAENGLSFKAIEITEKSSDERLYEFNYTDINPSSVKMGTSGKRVFVTLNTNFNEEIIQYYENGDIENYQSEIEIQATDIENARRIAALFKEIVGEGK